MVAYLSEDWNSRSEPDSCNWEPPPSEARPEFFLAWPSLWNSQYDGLLHRAKQKLKSTLLCACLRLAAQPPEMIQQTAMETLPFFRSDEYSIYNSAPKLVNVRLEVGPSHGWGLWIEDEFHFPGVLKTIIIFLAFCLVFGTLFYCLSVVERYGYSVFGIWGTAISFCAFVATLLFKYVDAKK